MKSGSPLGSRAVADHVSYCRELGFNAVWVYSGDAGAWAARAAPRGPFLFPSFRDFARSCRASGLRLVVSINPVADSGGSFVFEEAEAERRIGKFLRLLRSVGVRDFVLSFDDQPTELVELRDIVRFGRCSAPAHLDLAARVERFLRREERLWLCGAAYSDAHLDDPEEVYGKHFLAGLPRLPQRIGIVWTGPEVVSREIRLEQIRATRARLGGRSILLYDNYPVNDDGPRDALGLVLGPLRNRDPRLHEEVEAYLACPMTELGASRLPLATVADYLRDPPGYDPDRSWIRAIQNLAGDERDVLDAVKTQAMEWGGWVGTLNYHPRWKLDPKRVASSLDDPAFVASFEWTVLRYPERMERIGRARDSRFRDDVLEVMARRLAIARALPLVLELRARRRAGRSDLEELVGLLAREREGFARWPNAQRVLDRFLAACGIALPEPASAGRPTP